MKLRSIDSMGSQTIVIWERCDDPSIPSIWIHQQGGSLDMSRLDMARRDEVAALLPYLTRFVERGTITAG